MPTRPERSRLVSLLLALLVLLSGAGCRVGYVVKSAWYQGELLASRRPLDEVLAEGTLDERQRAALAIVQEAKTFGERLGLRPTKNYGTLAYGWDREIWAVSGCDPLAFQAKTWWFPIVGRVPYLGHFREQDAVRTADALAADGLDAYRRTAGAYSTLGWFRDPILPSMLTWSEADLADTVLHELAHATVWIRGSVAFNESFASFVGEEAAFRFLDEKYGPSSPQALAARAEHQDLETWRRLQHALYQDLERVYGDAALSDAEKLAQKQALFAGLPARVAAAGMNAPERWVRAAERGTWNNARLIQFKTYNESRAVFEALLARRGGDLLAFMGDVREIARQGGDPFAAMARAAERGGDHDTDVAQ